MTSLLSMKRRKAFALLLMLLGAACQAAGSPTPAATPTQPPPTSRPAIPTLTAGPTSVPSTPLGGSTPTGSAELPDSTLSASTPTVLLQPGPSGGRPGAEGVGDPYNPRLGNGGYDVQHYLLDLDVDVEDNIISGTVTARAVATQDLSAFNLDFIGFEIGQVHVNGEGADYERAPANGRELTIRPPQLLAQGQPFTVAISYAGTPRPYRSPGVPFPVGWTHYAGGTYVASEPDAAAAWFPVNDHPTDKATYTFRVTVDEPYVVAANGLLQDVVDRGATHTYLWEASDPLASYLVTVDIAEYVIQTEEGPDGLPIRNFFPADLADQAAYDFARTAEMIQFFSDLFGPFPFEAYGVVVIGPVPFALETQTLSVFGANSVTGQRDAERVVAHELVHQWYGDSVSPAVWGDIWLNEGFATFGQDLWYERNNGRAALEERIREMYALVSGEIWADLSPEERRARVVEQFPPPGIPPHDDLFNQSVYLRGGLTLHALRLRLGDARFFEVLRTYHDRFRYSAATTADFITVAEEVSGQDLGPFFQGWLFEQPVPAIPELGLTAPPLP